jgi:hypothetical protein
MDLVPSEQIAGIPGRFAALNDVERFEIFRIIDEVDPATTFESGDSGVHTLADFRSLLYRAFGAASEARF